MRVSGQEHGADLCPRNGSKPPGSLSLSLSLSPSLCVCGSAGCWCWSNHQKRSKSSPSQEHPAVTIQPGAISEQPHSPTRVPARTAAPAGAAVLLPPSAACSPRHVPTHLNPTAAGAGARLAEAQALLVLARPEELVRSQHVLMFPVSTPADVG